jgi:hypothetical protein
MSRKGRSSWRGPLRLLGAAACVAAVTFGLVAAVGIFGRDSGSGHKDVAAAAAEDMSPGEIDTLLTPVTPDDYLSHTKTLIDFQNRAGGAIQHRCYADAGYPDADKSTFESDNAQLHNFESPTVLRQRGFGVFADARYAPASADGSPPPAESINAPRDIIDHCNDVTAQVAGPLLALTDKPLGQWWGAVQESESSPEMQPAWTAWSACMAADGYQVASDDDFFKLADATLLGPGGTPEVEMKMANSYADCLEQGVLQAREQVRSALRSQYVASNADDFKRAESELPAAIAALSKASGVAYGQ